MKRNSFALSAAFTLIELLVVMAIIGVLAAIAIPQFASYRTRSFDAAALADLKNAATAEEAYYAGYERYIDCIGSAACQATLPAFRPSTNVTVDMFEMNIAGLPDHFTGRSYHPSGTHNNAATAYQWNSYLGGLQ